MVTGGVGLYGAGSRFYERHDFRILELGDGSGNEEGCPDVLYEWA